MSWTTSSMHQITDCHSWELPEDLFDAKAGETRPSKPVKKVVKTAGAETKPVRRSINDVEVSLSELPSWHPR
jgi:hypothetical protein